MHIVKKVITVPLQILTANYYMSNHKIKKLHIGSGKNILSGWLNTDIQLKYILFGSHYLDATRVFPFDSESFDYVFSEHCIEHIARENVNRMLLEIYRVLKIGGKIRIATPDLEILVKLYSQKRKSTIQLQYRDFIAKRYFPNIKNGIDAHVLNNTFYNWGHKFLYDKETLTDLILKSGFSNINYPNPGESQDINLMNIEGHSKIVGTKLNDFETLVIEATKI